MREKDLFTRPYNKCPLHFFAHIFAAIIGFAVGFGVLWIFYQSTVMAVIGAIIAVPMVVYVNISLSKQRRLRRLLSQFQSLLESLVVSLQAGGTDLGAFQHALEDLTLMYSDRSDIVKETNLIINKFANRSTIGEALMDFAQRSGLDDIRLFATVYMSVEGKGDKTRDIVVRTQKTLSDKISIQEEIKTMSAGAAMEINVIVVMPIIIVAVMGSMGGDMMAGLFTPIGRVVSTIAIVIFVSAYVLGRKITKIKV